MLVTAYKDPDTGNIFETEEAMAAFQVENRKRQVIEAAANETAARYKDLRAKMVAELADVRELAMYFKAIYEAWFAFVYAKAMVGRIRPVRKGLMRAIVDSTVVDDIELLAPERKNGPMRLRLQAVVTVTGDLDWYESQGLDWSLGQVLAPFQFTGSCNSRDGEGRKQIRRYSGLVVDLTELPKLKKAVDKFGFLLLTAEKHQRDVDALQEAATDADEALFALDATRKAAREAMEKATRAYYDVDEAYEVRRSKVCADVAQNHPFASDEELRVLTAAVGGVTTSAACHLGLTYHLNHDD